MKKFYIPLLLAGLFGQRANAQTGAVRLTPPTGSPTTYTSIGAAYAAVPTPVTGNYLVELLTTYNGSTETYPIQLTDKGLTAGGSTITIRPAAGNNSAVIQRPTAAAGAVIQFNGADNVILDGRPGGVTSTSASYLTVNDSYAGGGSANRNIEILNAANNNIVRYVKSIAADAITQAGAGAGSRNILIGSTTTTGNNNNTIANCIVVGGLRGIQDFGLSDAVPNSGTVISNDTVRNFGAIGIFAGTGQNNITIQSNYVTLASYNVNIAGTSVAVTGIQQQSLVSGTSNILNNTISLVSTSTTVSNLTAITDLGTGTENITGNNIVALSTPSSATATSNFIVGLSVGATTGGASTFNISRNKIAGLTSNGAVNFRGFSAFPAAGSTVNFNNNFVAITDANTNASAIFGLLFGTTAGANYTSNIYYNSIRIGGTQATTSSTTAYGILKGDDNLGSVYNQRNNISVMERTGGTATARFYGFLLNSTNGTNVINNNTYFALDSTNNGFAAGGWDGFIYRNGGLAAYKTGAAPQEQNSNFANVSFVSATDLHLATPSSTALMLYGAPITGITTDIDGQTRSATTPFQGADEPLGTPTPVELISFTGEGKDSYNLLQWRTVTESNNNGFSLERSVDGKNFTSIGFIKSKAVNGNSASAIDYTFSDVKPFATKGFYRLKQIDNDGKVTYSPIVIIGGKIPVTLTIASLYPNPVVDKVNLIIKTPSNKKVMISVINTAGVSLMQQTTSLKTGENTLSLNTGAYASGMYTISVRDLATNKIVNKQFIK